MLARGLKISMMRFSKSQVAILTCCDWSRFTILNPFAISDTQIRIKQLQKGKKHTQIGRLTLLGGLCIFSIAEFLAHFLREKIFTGDFWNLWPLHIPGFRAWFNYPGPSNPCEIFCDMNSGQQGMVIPESFYGSCHATYKWGHGRPINARSKKASLSWVRSPRKSPRSSYSKNGWNCPNICGWLPNHLWDWHGLFVDPPCQVLPLLIEVRFLHSIFCMAMALDGASQPLAYQAHQASWKLCAWEGLYGQGPRSQGSTKSPGCRGEIFHYFCWPPKKEREREMYMYRFLHRYIHINKKTSETNI